MKLYFLSGCFYNFLFVSDVLQLHQSFAQMCICFYLTCLEFSILLQPNDTCLRIVLFFSHYFFKCCLTSIFSIYFSRATLKCMLDLPTKFCLLLTLCFIFPNSLDFYTAFLAISSALSHKSLTFCSAVPYLVFNP